MAELWQTGKRSTRVASTELLRRFTVTFDYGRREIHLERNTGYEERDGRQDCFDGWKEGLSIDNAPSSLKVERAGGNPS